MSGLKNRLYGILALAAAVVLLAGCLPAGGRAAAESE